MKILFITSNRLGDAVLSTGLLSWLVDKYPGAQFTIACGPYASGLFGALPRLERILVMKKQSWNRHWLKLWHACATTRWDLIVDLRNSAITRLLSAKRKFYGGHHSSRHKVIEIADILNLSPPPAPKVWIDPSAEKTAVELLPADRPILALGPAANWACKQWPIENFAALAQRLTAANTPLAGARILVIAEEKERAQTQPLLQVIPDNDRVELFGQELAVVAACLKRVALFIGNDSGLMHLAAAAGAHTLGLFGPGYEDVYGPWGQHCTFVRTNESRDSLLATLAQSEDKKICLMTSLSVDKACDAAANLLALHS